MDMSCKIFEVEWISGVESQGWKTFEVCTVYKRAWETYGICGRWKCDARPCRSHNHPVDGSFLVLGKDVLQFDLLMNIRREAVFQRMFFETLPGHCSSLCEERTSCHRGKGPLSCKIGDHQRQQAVEKENQFHAREETMGAEITQRLNVGRAWRRETKR